MKVKVKVKLHNSNPINTLLGLVAVTRHLYRAALQVMMDGVCIRI
jgi:hypothetical protein